MKFIDCLDLKSYQAAFAANTARFKIGLWARQTGKDHTATAEAVLDCLHHPGATWLIVAASERQAIESLAKAKDWADILQFPVEEYIQAPFSLSRTAANELKWSNGSRLLALPANPSTIRGYSANIILTEFAFHENPDAIWRAIYPTISNPIRGGVKKLRIISTPNGRNNKFAHLWHSFDTGGARSTVPHLSPFPRPLGEPRFAERTSPLGEQISGGLGKPLGQGEWVAGRTGTELHLAASSANIPSSPSALSVSSALTLFHRSRITLHDAIAAGLPLDAAELQAGLNDPEAWSQEYLCEFMDNSTVLLPYDLIETCESPLASELSSPQSLSVSAIPGNSARPQLFAGIDFARKNHLTVCWILEKLPASSLPPSAYSEYSVVNPSSSPSALSASSAPSALNSGARFLTREVLCLRNTSTPEQLELLRPRIQHCRKVCLDYTGPGVGLGDYVIREFGASRVELCTFTSSLKAELFPRLAAAMESRQLFIPIGRDIREDLHSIYRTTTNSGNILYRAHATPDGHADRTTALALSLRAAQSAPTYGGATNVGRSFAMHRGTGRGRSSFTPRTIAIIH